ncbi:unnamed protein product [Penicillium salamii]|nr:unnamed protein product [Penicillium salamii]CAG8010246.1 unnamed protein product [Penicillium salamii]CAG8309811.1 unnamed protein product [Penicillium salamii]
MEKEKTGFDITYFKNGSQWQRESRASAEPHFLCITAGSGYSYLVLQI